MADSIKTYFKVEYHEWDDNELIYISTDVIYIYLEQQDLLMLWENFKNVSSPSLTDHMSSFYFIIQHFIIYFLNQYFFVDFFPLSLTKCKLILYPVDMKNRVRVTHTDCEVQWQSCILIYY